MFDDNSKAPFLLSWPSAKKGLTKGVTVLINTIQNDRGLGCKGSAWLQTKIHAPQIIKNKTSDDKIGPNTKETEWPRSSSTSLASVQWRARCPPFFHRMQEPED